MKKITWDKKSLESGTLTRIQIAGGIYDSRDFEKIKMAWSKNTFYPKSIPPKLFANYLVKGPYKKKLY